MANYAEIAEEQDFIEWTAAYRVQIKAERVRDDILKQMQLRRDQFDLVVRLRKAEATMDCFKCLPDSEKTFEKFCDLDQDVRFLKYDLRKVEEQMTDI